MALDKTERDRLFTVLVVEDDPSQRYTLTSLLEREGYAVTACSTAQEAVEAVERRDFGVAVVDLRLPDQQGIRLMERIHEYNRRLRVIIHTAHGSFGSAKDSVNKGAFAYVEKAGEPDVLISHVNRALHEQMDLYTTDLEAAVAERTEALQRANDDLRREAVRREQTQEELRAAHGELRQIFNAASPLCVIAADGTVLRVNDMFCQLFAVEREQLEGRKCYDLWPGRMCSSLECPLHQVVSSQERIEYEVSETLPNGRELHCAAAAIPYKSVDGEVTGIVETFMDITGRKRTEDALRQSEEKLRIVLESSPDRILILQQDGTIEYINRVDEGWERRRVTGSSCFDYVPPEKQRLARRMLDRVFSGESVQTEHEGPGDRYYSTRLVPIRHDSRVVSALCISSDITDMRDAERERAKLEDRLRQAHRMEAVGTLASGVAHDFNNLLTAIIGYTEYVKTFLPDQAEASAAVEGIESAAQQATGVTRKLLTFSRRTPGKKIPLNLGRVVGETVQMLSRILPAAIDMTADISTNQNVFIEGDPTQLQQVVMNLAVNARDAMIQGGKLRISVAYREGDFSDVLPSVQQPDRGAVTLMVEDTGTGMDAQVQARLFEPFFTTKPRERGTGMGMAVVHGIVNDHRGHIRVESQEGRGTRIIIDFPPCEVPASFARVEQRPKPQRGRGETVLVVEDNPQVLGIVSSSLDSAGYEVVRALDGEEAMTAFDSCRERARLVIIDVDLPKKSGPACLSEMRQENPELPAIIITGSVEANVDSSHDGQTRLLRKPFRLFELKQLVSEVIGKKGPG